jgi:hypothetical protein
MSDNDDELEGQRWLASGENIPYFWKLRDCFKGGGEKCMN